MNDNIKVGHFEADGGLINLPIGFIPDYFKLVEVGVTNPNFYEWFRLQEQDEASNSQEGSILTGSTGVTTQSVDGAGIIAFNAGSEGPTVTEWTEAVATAATARTATAAGTYVKATVANSADRGSIFECVTAGTGGSTEPTWPNADGGQVTDNSVVWEKVNVDKQRTGYEGVVISATIQTNGREYYYLALQAVQAVDHGDVDGWTDGSDPNA